MRWQPYISALLAGALFSSCSLGKGGKPEIGANPFGPTGVPPKLRGQGDEGGTPIKGGGNEAAKAEAAAAAAGFKSSELAWTDPDNPDAELPELQELMAAAPQGSEWLESEGMALRESKKTGKPVFIWFTDSLRSAACKTLSAELFTKSEFQQWAEENTVRLVVDQEVKGKDPDDTARKKLYVRDLKKKYNARGYPTLMILSPSGEVIGRYKSYSRGKEDFIWGQLKQGVSLAKENHEAWKKSLERKGYREWTDNAGKTIFAKLGAYRDGDLILMEPDGQRIKAHEKKLSAADRVWIQQQKEARGIQ
jgi:thioredoxin-related protein